MFGFRPPRRAGARPLRAHQARLSLEACEARELMAASIAAPITAPIAAMAIAPMSTNDQYVEDVFNVVLFRAPSAAEQNNFATRLNSGSLSRDRFVLTILESREHKENLVQGAYNNILGFAPNQNQLNQGVALLNRGSLIQLEARLFASPAFRNGFTNRQFVQQVAASQGVTPTRAAEDALTRALDRGRASHESIARQILESPNALRNRVNNSFQNYNGVAATGAEMQQSLEVIRRGTRFGVDRLILSRAPFA